MIKQKTIGKILLDDTVDITDPGYDKDIWCRINDLSVVPGEYTCISRIRSSYYTYEGKRHKDVRVASSGIYLNGVIPPITDFEDIGTIGVDAGIAGYFPHKKDFNDEEWSEFCKKIEIGNAWIIENGFCTSSGYGDGIYTVRAYKDATGRARAIKIEFL